MAIIGKDLLSLKDMPAETISLILDTAKSMKEIMSRQIKKVPTLRVHYQSIRGSQFKPVLVHSEQHGVFTHTGK